MKSTGTLVKLQREQEDDAGAVLAAAFRHDPVVNYFFEDITASNDPRLQELYRFCCRVRFDLGWPLMGVESDGVLVAVAGIDEPGAVDWPQSLAACYQSFQRVAGPDSVKRIETYASLPDQHRPKDPHFLLGMIGVLSGAQGRGHARLLLDWLHDASASHPTSVGVALDTSTNVNVSMYKHFGYEVLGCDDLVGHSISTMYRPNPK